MDGAGDGKWLGDTVESFQEILEGSWDPYLYRYLPVEWFDRSRSVWRTTLLDSVDANTGDAGIAIVIPFEEEGDDISCGLSLVQAKDLRLSTAVPECTTRFATFRYTLELLELLSPCFKSAVTEDQQQFMKIAESILRDYRQALRTWAVEFKMGSEAGYQDQDAKGVASVDHFEIEPAWHECVVGHERMETLNALMTARERSTSSPAIWSPVSFWDCTDGVWRPTLMLGKVESDEELTPSKEFAILYPGTPLSVMWVSGADLRTDDLHSMALSIYALPIIAHDIRRVTSALGKVAWHTAPALHPMVDSLRGMLESAVEEWNLYFSQGMPGDAPAPRVAPLALDLWGFSVPTATDPQGGTLTPTGDEA